MKNVKYILAAAILSCSILSQSQESEVKPQLKMKLIMEDDENGKITRFDSTFAIEDKEKVQAILKEKGIEWNINELNIESMNIDSMGSAIKIKVEDFNLDDQESTKFKFIEAESGDNEEHEIHLEAIIKDAKRMAKEAIENGEDAGNHGNNVFIIKREISTGESDQDIDFDEDAIEKVIVRKIKIDGDELTEIEDILEQIELKTMVFIVDSENSFDDDRNGLPTEINEDKLENLEISKLKLFPNPTTGQFNMSFKSNKEKDINISITDLAGKLIFEKQLNQFKGKFSEEFDLSNQEKGIYFFNIVTGNEKETRKVIVQ